MKREFLPLEFYEQHKGYTNYIDVECKKELTDKNIDFIRNGVMQGKCILVMYKKGKIVINKNFWIAPSEELFMKIMENYNKIIAA